MRGVKTVIDLGSGDGYVLRILEFLKFKNIAGVELDTSLHEIAVQNLSKSTLINGDFRSVGEWIGFQNFELIYVFNPAPEAELFLALEALSSQKLRYVLCKNFQLAEEHSLLLGLKAKRINDNYLLYEFKFSKK